MDGIQVKVVITLPNGDVQEIPLDAWNIEHGIREVSFGDGRTFRDYDGTITLTGSRANR